MKKIITLILLLSATMVVSAQKMTIKTASGQTVEISCDGMMPAEVQVEGDKVTFKMNAEAPISEVAEAPVSKVAEVPISEVAETPVSETAEPAENIAFADSVKGNATSTWADLANGLAEELSPEYKAFNEAHKNDHPKSEKEVIKNVAKQFVDEDVVETADFVGTLFGQLRFTKDSTFVAKYEQRKPKKSWRTYDILELSGSFGKNIEGVSVEMAEKINPDDYGDDTGNENKFGGGIKYSHIYISGTETKDGWKPNPLGFAWSWGGLVDFSYEKDMGSYISAMGKIGVQIGHEIAFGVDGLMGCGIIPYNTFYTNGINHSMLNKSAFCFKYGVQLWGSLNFSKDTYTAIYGRYIMSVGPKSAISDLPDTWDMIVEDFDPSCWGVGLAVGYKFGAPKALSTDKRLQASIGTGYQFAGKQKGMIISGEVERFTQVSRCTSLNYGLAVEELFGQDDNNERYVSVLFSAGFKVNQPNSRCFWGTKLYAGVGDCAVSVNGGIDSFSLKSTSKKLCAKVALQVNGGYKVGKMSELFGALRLGFHLGKSTSVDGLEKVNYTNLSGLTADMRVGYRYTF